MTVAVAVARNQVETKEVSKMARNGKGISLKPRDATRGGLPDDLDVTVEKSFFRVGSTSDYTTDAEVGEPGAVPLWTLTLQPEDGESFDLHMSCGSIDRLVPSQDGSQLIPAEDSNAQSLSDSCNAYIMLESMVKCEAELEEKLLDDISIVEGMKFHLLRKPAPKRAGLEIAEAEGETRRARTVPTCSEILELPWEKGGKKKAKAAAGKPVKGKAAVEEDEEEEEEEEEEEGADDAASSETEAIITSLLEDEPAGIKAAALYKRVFAAAKKSKNKAAIVDLAQDEDWLGDDERPWVFAKGVVKPA